MCIWRRCFSGTPPFFFLTLDNYYSIKIFFFLFFSFAESTPRLAGGGGRARHPLDVGIYAETRLPSIELHFPWK